MSDLPLGRPTPVPQHYDPTVLRGISRTDARQDIGLGSVLPFAGVDYWTAWELTWLDSDGKPIVATASIAIDCASPYLVESKSLKLYLTSLANTRFAHKADVETTITKDLRRILNIDPELRIDLLGDVQDAVAHLPGDCIDAAEMGEFQKTVDASVLRIDPTTRVDQTLKSHLLRSLCPVTGQPDFGSLSIRYRGPAIQRAGLLSYLVSFRNHEDFHEACVERIFVDLKARCRCECLSVYARYTRRGGIDINPFRSDFESAPDNVRLWRQ